MRDVRLENRKKSNSLSITVADGPGFLQPRRPRCSEEKIRRKQEENYSSPIHLVHGKYFASQIERFMIIDS